MTYIKSLIICSFIVCLLPLYLKAQESTDKFGSNQFRLGFEIGYSSNFISGEGSNEINKMIEEFENTGRENFLALGRKSPQQYPILGILLQYQYSERFSFGSGLRFTKRGYEIKIRSEEKDPEYQFDHNYKYDESYSINMFELPLKVLYKYNENWTITAGAIIGIGLKNSAKFKYLIEQEVYINGELSDEFTADRELGEDNLTESPSNPFFGGLISFDYNIAQNLFASISFSRAINYAEVNYGQLSDTSFALSLKYSFISF